MALGQTTAPTLGPSKPITKAEAIENAIESGKKFLLGSQQPNGSWAGMGAAGASAYPVGPTAMATYALLECGEGAQSPKMVAALKWLSTNKAIKTYELGIRCNVWLIANAQTKGKYFACLQDDADTLVHAVADRTLPGSGTVPGKTISGDGSYTYDATQGPVTGSDGSNSQYGVLGVWGAARGGRYEVPDEYWSKIMKCWWDRQNVDGGWGYVKSQPSSGTMAAAGVATMFVCYDNLFSGSFIKCTSSGDFGPIQRGLDWFDHNFEAVLSGKALLTNNVGDPFYFFYGVERVGLASGYKYFGTSDWFKLGADNLLAKMNPGGGWVGGAGGADVTTSYALLFLVRGRNAVLFNKLEFESVGAGGKTVATDWRCRPRDLAMLTTWIGRQFESTLNWQIINLKVPVKDWHDAPILYIAGSLEPRFSPEDIAKLRQYVLQGGSIFSCAECGDTSPKFAQGIRNVYKLLFPEYELVEISPTHDIYSDHVQNKLQGKPKFFMISNGVRPLVIHTDEDLPKAWQLNRTGTASVDFQAAENLFMYLTDKGKLRKRGTFTWPDEVKSAASRGTVKITRLKWNGNWNPEPLALERFTRLMAVDQQLDVQVVEPDKGVTPADLAKADVKLAILSGVGTLKLEAADVEALKDFVSKGNILLVESAGGDKEFNTSADTILKKAYEVGIIPALGTAAEVYNLKIPDGKLEEKNGKVLITQMRYRSKTGARAGIRTGPALKAVTVKEKPAIFLSREDISNAGLVGYQCYDVDGYDPGDGVEGSAYRMLRNIVIYAAFGVNGPSAAAVAPAAAPETTPATPPATKPAEKPATK
jgi:hypothetical protein